MKIKIINICVILVLFLSSCNGIGDVEVVSSQNTATSEDIDHQSETEAIAGEGIAVNLKNYDEFLLFKKGKLDVSLPYTFDDKAVIDVRTMLDLKSWDAEQVIIENDNEFRYNVYSLDTNGNKIIEYYVVVTYNPTGFQTSLSHIDSIPTFKSIKDADNTDTFKIQEENCLLVYSQGSSGYLATNLILDHYKIHICFGAVEVSTVQIRNKCGDLVASLFSEDQQEVSIVASSIIRQVDN